MSSNGSRLGREAGKTLRMPRSVRIEYPGAVYHVMCRGDRREEIFLDGEDRERFVFTLGEACARTGAQVHGYVLMGNRYHLLLETPEPNLVATMKWFAPPASAPALFFAFWLRQEIPVFSVPDTLRVSPLPSRVAAVFFRNDR